MMLLMPLLKKNSFLLVLLLTVLGLALMLFVPALQSAQAQSETPPFTDINSDAWYYEYVDYLAREDIFEGTNCEEGFCPGQPLLRWQMAVWMIRALETENPSSRNESRFEDVENGDWWLRYVERMADLEITVGCSSNPPNFCPHEPVTRSQMASFLSRAFDLPVAEAAGFEDVDHKTNVHAINIDRLAATKITVGCKQEPFNYCPANSVTKAQMAAFIYRALQWQKQTADQENDETDNPVTTYNPDTFYTAENDLSRLVKHELVDKYADKHPWLLETWNYTNRPEFEYRLENISTSSVSIIRVKAKKLPGEILDKVLAAYLQTDRGCISDRYCMIAIVHEMAHVYTLSNDAPIRPGPIGAANLYFEYLGQGVCGDAELFADAAAASVPVLDNDYTPYWHYCEHLPFNPDEETLEVVRQAFAGEMPDWFYETFQKPDGTLDYEALWAKIKTLDDRVFGHQTRALVVRQLKDEFGGYCSEQAAYDSAFGESDLIQPWRDGGCQ